jgi:hypothetical protein
MTKFTDLPIEILRIIYEEYEGNYKYRDGTFVPQIPFERKIPLFYIPIPKVTIIGNNWAMYITLQDYNGYDDYSVILVKQNFTFPHDACIDCRNRRSEDMICYLYKRNGMIQKMNRGIVYNDTTFRYV